MSKKLVKGNKNKESMISVFSVKHYHSIKSLHKALVTEKKKTVWSQVSKSD